MAGRDCHPTALIGLARGGKQAGHLGLIVLNRMENALNLLLLFV